MDPDRVKKLVKRTLFVLLFFALAVVFFLLPETGLVNRTGARVLLIAYVLIVCVLMVCAVLLQSGRGGGLASLGGVSGDSLLGTRSATPIAKATYVLGALFLFISMLIAMRGRESVGEVPGVLPGGLQSPVEMPAPPPAPEAE